MTTLGLRIHPQAAPSAGTALAYLALACMSLLVFILMFLPLPAENVQPDLYTLALLHLLAIGFGASAFIGVARHMTMTTLRPKTQRAGVVYWAPGIHGLATGLLAAGFLMGRFWLCGLAGLAVAGELIALFVSLRFAIKQRSQTGALHAFMTVAGVSLILVSLLGAVFGFHLASGLSPAAPMRELHAFLAAGGFFSIAVMGASAQLVPMFSASPSPKRSFLPMLILCALAGLLVGVGALLTGVPGIAEGWMSATLVLWLFFTTRAWRSGRARLTDPFFFLARVGELSLMATSGVLLAGGSAILAAAIFFLGFLIPTVLGYMSRIVPFLLWLFLVERFGFARTIPKIDRYLPKSWPSIAGACYVAGLLLALPGMAGSWPQMQASGRLLLTMGAAIYVGCLVAAGMRARHWITHRT